MTANELNVPTGDSPTMCAMFLAVVAIVGFRVWACIKGAQNGDREPLESAAAVEHEGPTWPVRPTGTMRRYVPPVRVLRHDAHKGFAPQPETAVVSMVRTIDDIRAERRARDG